MQSDSEFFALLPCFSEDSGLILVEVFVDVKFGGFLDVCAPFVGFVLR